MIMILVLLRTVVVVVKHSTLYSYTGPTRTRTFFHGTRIGAGTSSHRPHARMHMHVAIKTLHAPREPIRSRREASNWSMIGAYARARRAHRKYPRM